MPNGNWINGEKLDWILPNNKIINISIHRYRINWNKPGKSKGAQIVQNFLKKYCPFDVICAEMLLPRSRLRLDYINFSKKFCWEHSGKQHFEYTPFFHKSRTGYINHLRRDGVKIKEILRNNFKFIETCDADLKFLSPIWIEKEFGVIL